MSLAAVTLTGKHVRLEPLCPEHLDGLCAIGLDRALWEVVIERVETREQMAGYIARAQTPASLAFAVVHMASGRIAGSTRYMNYEPAHKRVEIGSTWYGAEFQRTAVNTESKLLLLTHAFEALCMNRVELKTDLRNLRSQTAIERIGARREGVLRHHMITWTGHLRDTVYFSILAAEWPAAKAALEAKLG
jgi:N-acetyltransferase